MPRVAFRLTPQLHLLDLAGPDRRISSSNPAGGPLRYQQVLRVEQAVHLIRLG